MDQFFRDIGQEKADYFSAPLCFPLLYSFDFSGQRIFKWRYKFCINGTSSPL